MSTPQLEILLYTAFTLGLIHTLIGPDHYLPFIVLSKARKWSFSKTLGITFLCGLGHVLSSILLGIIGILVGIAITQLQFIESTRGEIAAWGLIIFGLIYGTWGLCRGLNPKAHQHTHLHLDGEMHQHDHSHSADLLHTSAHLHNHANVSSQTVIPSDSIRSHDHNEHDHDEYNHDEHEHEENEHDDHDHDEHDHKVQNHETHTLTNSEKRTLTFWSIFIIFVLGPCEPLIPLVMVPAIYSDWVGIGLVSLVFGGTTVIMMLLLVGLAYFGLFRLNMHFFNRFIHAIAGYLSLQSAGLTVVFLGL